jgi:NAD(P)-dependent dehydrogenase (short-subunit alcohol dehydrogenase family)
MDMFTLSGKTAVITGGASGIGRATAARFALAGARVIIADRTDAAEFAREIGGNYVETDVRDEPAVEELLARTAEFGPLDILINSAGITSEAALPDIEIAEFDRMLATNTRSVLLTMKHAVKYMTNGGAIVNVSSLAAFVGLPAYGCYAASKAAVIALTKVAALEYGPLGIRVNCICPTSVDTPMLRAQPGGELEAALARTAAPLGRICSAADVAALLHFLSADDCPLISGQALSIDGGATAGFSVAILEGLAAGIDAAGIDAAGT